MSGAAGQAATRSGRVICADAVAAMADMTEASAHLIVADPPYNLGKHFGNNIDRRRRDDYDAFTRAWLAQACRVLRPGGSIYVFMGVRYIAHLYRLLEEEFKLCPQGWITWHYTQGMGRKRGYSPRHEDILFFSKGREITFNLEAVRVPQKFFRRRNNMAGANPGDVWQFSHVHYCSAERLAHPTQKPEALIERIVRASSNPGDLVLDPFLGSGTTARVAAALDRRWIGVEVNPDYVKLATERLAKPFTGFDSIDPRKSRRPRDLPTAAD